MVERMFGNSFVFSGLVCLILISISFVIFLQEMFTNPTLPLIIGLLAIPLHLTTLFGSVFIIWFGVCNLKRN